MPIDEKAKVLRFINGKTFWHIRIRKGEYQPLVMLKGRPVAFQFSLNTLSLSMHAASQSPRLQLAKGAHTLTTFIV